MLLTILSGIVLIVGIVVLIIGNYYWGTDVLNIIGFSFAFIGVLVLSVCSVLAIITAATKDKVYQDMLYQRKVLEYRLSHEEENTIGNELLYSDIVEFNMVMNTVQTDEKITAIKTRDNLNWQTKGYISTQNGEMWIIDQIIVDEQIHGYEQAVRLMRTPAVTEYLLRLVSVKNPWEVGKP